MTLPTTSRSITGPDGIAARLAPSIRAASDELDRSADLPAHLMDQVQEAGALRLLTPVELGGLEASPTTVLEVYEELGGYDISVAWVVWNANWGFVSALLPEAASTQIWPAGGPEPIFANSGSPGGIAVPVQGGYRLSGNWKIVSGVNAANWLVVVAMIQPGEEATAPAGPPDVRLFAVPKEQVTVSKTWNVSGMRSTGSNDVKIDDVLVPAERVARIDEPSRIDRPLYRGFVPALVLPGCTAAVLGLTRAAVDETIRLSRTKRTMMGGTLSEETRVQKLIAASEADLRAARLLLFDAARTLEQANVRNETVTAEQRAALRAAMSHAARVSRQVLVAMYELSSSSGLYIGSPIERLFRDGMVALQHVNHAAVAFEGVGRVRFGFDPQLPLF